MRIAALAGHRVDRFDVVGAVAIEEVVDHGDDVVLAHARPQLLVHEVIGAVDHAGGVVQERDFVLRLDLACFQHDLLTVGDLEAGFLQFEHHRRFDDVDADRHVGDAVFAQDRGEFLGVLLHQAEGGRHGAAQADQAGLAVLRVEPRRIELVMHGGGAEVPQDRFAGAGQQRPARQLVALPLADLGRGEIADVVDVEHQQRAKFGLLQCLLGAAEAVAVQAAEIDALLEVDAHDAERGQRAAPVVARVDVLGADLTDGLVHGSLLEGSCTAGDTGSGLQHYRRSRRALTRARPPVTGRFAPHFTHAGPRGGVGRDRMKFQPTKKRTRLLT